MKVKLAILDQDKNYLKRLQDVFTVSYFDKLEIYLFSDKETALSNLKPSRIDVFLAASDFEINVDNLPKKCNFAYLTEEMNIDSYKNQHAICKFQKAEMIYKEILSLYSEKMTDTMNIKFDSAGKTKIIAFVSASGGTGSSTVAAACAKYCSNMGKKILYLNVEKFGFIETFFSADGTADFSDVIFALKSKKANLPIKIESCIRQDKSGVFFFQTAKNPIDMQELEPDDLATLVKEINLTGNYDYLIMDADFTLDSFSEKVLSLSNLVVMVSDGSQISNAKFIKAYKTLDLYDSQKETSFLPKIRLMYNKFSSKTGKIIDEDFAASIGGIPRVEQATSEQIIDRMRSTGIFQQLL